MTTKDIIKILPVKKEYKIKLLNEFDILNPDQKFVVEQIIWRAYRSLYNGRLTDNLQLAFSQAAQNKDHFDQDFYKRVVEKTDKEMESEATETITKLDLSSTRQELKKIIKKPGI